MMNHGQQMIANGANTDPQTLLPNAQLKQIYVTLTNMKQQGKEGDPTYVYLMDFLKAQLALLKQRQQQQQQQQGMGVTDISNMLLPQQQQQQQQQQPPLQQHQEMVLFTQDQKNILKAQIYAFRNHIVKREMLPAPLLKALCGDNIATNLQEYERYFLAHPQQQQQQQQIVHQSASTSHSESIPSQSNLRTLTPEQQQQQHLRQQIVLKQPLQNQQQQQLMSGSLQQTGNIIQRTNNSGMHAELLKTPMSVSLQLLYHERDRRIGLEMKQSFEDLKTQMNHGTQDERVKAVLEMKKMQLLSLQKQVRQKILQEMKATTQIRPHSHGVERVIPGMDLNKMRGKKGVADVEKERKKKHNQFIRDVLRHQKDFASGSNMLKDRASKINAALLKYHERKAKLEREARQRDERARLKALKENDTDAYFKLLEEAKVDKIKELIEETDRCLAKLGAKVMNRPEEVEDDGEMAEGEEGESFYSKHLKSQRAYYELAHTVKEKIETQPTMMKSGELKPYQMAGLQWLVSLYNNNLNGILADEMGLGKTIQTIALLAHIYEYKNNRGPHLVIVPLGTIENWRMEFEKWCPTIKVIKYGGKPPERKKLQRMMRDRDFNVLLIQYEYVSRDRTALSRIAWEYIIIDEGHRIKNQESKLLKDLLRYKSNHRLLLTGTPLQNDLSELWSLLNFLLPHVFSDSFDFNKWFNTAFNSSDSVEISEEETLLIINRLHQVLRPFLLRREKDEVKTQLPEKVEKLIRCDVSAMQKLLIDTLQSENKLLSIDRHPRFRMRGMANPIMALRKICNHPFLTIGKHAAWSQDYVPEDLIRMSGKMELLHRMLAKLHRTDHRILLFSQMTQQLDLIEEYLDYFGYKDQYMRLDGNTKAEERAPMMKKFNAPDSKYFLFLLSTRAGGLGLNLQSADTVIIFDSDWNPQMDLQAQARAHRLGQTKAVRVFTFLTATSVEEGMYQRATDKRAVEAKVIGAGKFNQRSTHKERQDFLAELIKQSSTEENMPVPSDEELNDMIARTEEEFELFQQMDREYEKEMEDRYKALGKPVPSRLVSKEELPQWLFEATENDVKHGTMAQDGAAADGMSDLRLGRGKRRRQTVRYMEMTDEQFENAMLASDDEEDEDAYEDDDQSEMDNEFETPRKKQRRKSENIDVSKQTTMEAENDGADGLSNISALRKEELVAQLHEVEKKITTPEQQLFFQVYKDVLLVTDGDGFCISDPFLQLPDKELYPDYYNVVKNPISFQEIEDKIVANAYTDLEQMAADVELLTTNAQMYNLEGSAIHNDSITLWNRFLESKREIEQTMPSVQEDGEQ